jgi:hypothetical protein
VTTDGTIFGDGQVRSVKMRKRRAAEAATVRPPLLVGADVAAQLSDQQLYDQDRFVRDYSTDMAP